MATGRDKSGPKPV